MSRLQATFKRLQREGRKALIPYATAGYPYADITPALMHVLVEAGADVIELGVPFSDPSGVLSQNRRNFRHPSSSPATSASRSIILPSLWKV